MLETIDLSRLFSFLYKVFEKIALLILSAHIVSLVTGCSERRLGGKACSVGLLSCI